MEGIDNEIQREIENAERKKRYDARAACEGVRRFRPDDTKI